MTGRTSAGAARAVAGEQMPADVGAMRNRVVMQLVLALSPGGTERLVVELVRRLPPPFRPLVCCLDAPGVWGDELRLEGTTVVSLNRKSGFRPLLAARIARIAAAHRVEVIHCHHYSPYVYGQLAARLLPGVRVVFTEHGRFSDGPPSRKRRLANQLFGRLPASILTVSSDLRDHVVAEGFSANRVRIITNGIDVREKVTADSRARARCHLGLGDDVFVTGTVGRLDPVKDIRTLIDGFARFRAAIRRPSLLLVVGDGTERESLSRHAESLGLGAGVRFLGHREDVRDLLPAFDLYAGTSIFEGVSLTILEAMAAGLPVVATAVGGTPEVVVDGVTGRLFPTRDPAAVAEAIRFVHDAADVASQWGRAGRERVVERFTIDGMVREYARVYSGRN